MKKVLEGMHLMSGYKGKREDVLAMNTKTTHWAYALNDCYARFGCHDFSEARANLANRLMSTPSKERGECVTMTENGVFQQLQRTNLFSTAGPDEIKPCILKYCDKQQYSVSFSISLRSVQDMAHVQDLSHSMM